MTVREDRRSRPGVTVALDAMGGDHAPEEIVAGAVTAVRRYGVQVVLVGRQEEIKPILTRHGAGAEIGLAHADDVVAMDDDPVRAARHKRSSSLAVALNMLLYGEVRAVVSAGSTGAVVATARLCLGRSPGVLRPALAAVLPTPGRSTVLLDAGAGIHATPAMLTQFAVMGSRYAELALGIPQPRVGLLSVGTEPDRGSRLVRAAHEQLATIRVQFIGNVEGCDITSDRVDVVVTDGITGNVALKAFEAGLGLALASTYQAITTPLGARLTSIPLRHNLRRVMRTLNPDTYGGAVLLGLPAPVVIAHGSSRHTAIASACYFATQGL